MADPHISVVIPAFNEELRLPSYLRKVMHYLERRQVDHEIIVVDDGSTDGTCRVVGSLSAASSRLRLLKLPENRGKGFAVKTGMLAAAGRLRLFADADGATPIEEMERLEAAMGRGADVAVASRAVRDADTIVDGRIHRKIIGTTFNFMVRKLAVPGIFDTQCGFKMFSAEAAETIFPFQTVEGFGFDVELLFIARRRGHLICEVPVNWTDIGGTKVRVVRDSARMLADIVKIRWHDLRGGYRPMQEVLGN